MPLQATLLFRNQWVSRPHLLPYGSPWAPCAPSLAPVRLALGPPVRSPSLPSRSPLGPLCALPLVSASSSGSFLLLPRRPTPRPLLARPAGHTPSPTGGQRPLGRASCSPRRPQPMVVGARPGLPSSLGCSALHGLAKLVRPRRPRLPPPYLPSTASTPSSRGSSPGTAFDRNGSVLPRPSEPSRALLRLSD